MDANHVSTPDPVLARFMARVQRDATTTECWLWTASRTPSGYGRFRPSRRPWVYAHRFAYEAQHGPIPPGLELDHLCRTPACVNPAHLEAVTHQENVLRGTGVAARNARKTHCLRGHRLPTVGRKRPCRDCGRWYRATHLDRVRESNRRAMARYRTLYPERARESRRRYLARRDPRSAS